MDEFNVIVKYQAIDSKCRVLQEGNYRNGMRDGIWYMYDYQGNVMSTMVFKMNERIKLITLDDMGDEITIFYVDDRPVKKVSIAYLDRYN